ncbi:MAG: polysaccharide deacetylase family protein [Acutalibacteraceae bacterium]|nr:polysaccharide deacetylase family protein [Acutalibacteraceae bacterium]
MKFGGKNKAITFSYDDGVTQDIRLIELLNKYGLKCTFNLNSALLGQKGILNINDKRISHYKVHPEDVKYIYDGHEIAVHTLSHPNLTQCDDDTVIRQVEEDRIKLSELAGYEVIGMAYPCGGVITSMAPVWVAQFGIWPVALVSLGLAVVVGILPFILRTWYKKGIED